jgi:hypothetical protein
VGVRDGQDVGGDGMTEALVFVALAAVLVASAAWLDGSRARRDARRRNQARPKGWQR